MECGTREEAERPLIGKAEDAEEEIDNLESRNGLNSAVEVLGKEIPENLGPEKAFNRGRNLVCWLLAKGPFGACGFGKKDVHMAAVSTMRRAQWFLISLPMVSN